MNAGPRCMATMYMCLMWRLDRVALYTVSKDYNVKAKLYRKFVTVHVAS